MMFAKGGRFFSLQRKRQLAFPNCLSLITTQQFHGPFFFSLPFLLSQEEKEAGDWAQPTCPKGRKAAR